MEEISVVIFCNKKDFYLTRICVASIRYYYPSISIFILKDYLNGYFDSKELENAFNVSVLDLGIEKYGWAAAKIHFLLNRKLNWKKVLMLDSDIIFIGPFLENLVADSQGSDVSVSAYRFDNPYDPWVYKTYYDFIPSSL